MLIAAGVIGVSLGMLNYWLLISGRVVSDGPAFLLINLTAVVLTLLSLFEQFNLPTLIINLFYGAVSVWGLCKMRTV